MEVRRAYSTARTSASGSYWSVALLAAPADQDLLYLGDSTEGRIIALKSNGELIGQIQSDVFRGMTDLATDPTGTALYILHGNEISVVVPPK